MRILLIALFVTFCLSVHVDHQWFWSNKGIEGSWKLTHVNGNPVATRNPATFKKGQFTLDYCNNMRGPYTVQGTNRLRFGGFVSTQKACMGQVPSESFVSTALINTQGYQLVNNNLHMFDGFGRPTLSFVR